MYFLKYDLSTPLLWSRQTSSQRRKAAEFFQNGLILSVLRLLSLSALSFACGELGLAPSQASAVVR